ncbi:MAG: hypothetical protein ACOYK6_03880 [Chthoniobacterales bacterium]
MKKLPILLAMTLMVFMSSTDPIKAQSTDNTQKNTPTLEELNQKIDHAWTRLQKSMTVDSPNAEHTSDSEYLAPDSPRSLLNAQIAILDYQRALGNKYAFQKYGADYEAAITPDTEEDSTDSQARISSNDLNNPAACLEIEQDFFFIQQEILKAYNKFSADDFNNGIPLKPTFNTDQSTAFNDFETRLSAQFDAAVSSYRASELHDSNERDPQQQQKNSQQVIFSTLKENILAEYVYVLLVKQESAGHPNEATAFKVLQQKLEQLLANVDVSNPVALLQAQMDMIAYENAVGGDVTK